MQDLEKFFLFPLATPDARKKFLIGCLVALAGAFIPLLPIFVYYGYIAKIMRQVLEDGSDPSMPEWGDLSSLLEDGLRLYGVHFIFLLPSLIIYLGGMLFIFPITMGIAQNRQFEDINLLIPMIIMMSLIMAVATPLVWAGFGLSYPAGIHAVHHKRFGAAFEFRAWWPIVRKNLAGFAIAFAAAFAIAMAYTMVYQILFFTLILICLVFPLTIGYTFYMSLVVQTLGAKAYYDGLQKLNQTAEPTPIPQP